jgi:hypothetical protein
VSGGSTIIALPVSKHVRCASSYVSLSLQMRANCLRRRGCHHRSLLSSSMLDAELLYMEPSLVSSNTFERNQSPFPDVNSTSQDGDHGHC